jgi:hypothetical protein
MTNHKPKQRKPKIELREPAKPLATPPEPRPLPSDHPVMEIFRQAQAATTHHPPPTAQSSSAAQLIAPGRDFVRVPNSVVRNALPSGLFKGESKKTYDALYQRTRGAVVPQRMIRATLAEVMAWANVSRNTLKAHLKHLSFIGLLKVHYVRGDNTGAEYEVFTPEEVPPTTHPPPTTQILGPPTTQNLGGGWWGQVVEKSISSGDRNTSFKTNTEKDDDEAFAGLCASLSQTAREITGKEPSPAEVERWKELGELLATELKLAAGRTGSVSSVPAFLTEHLRRRLWKKDKRQMEEEGKSAVENPKAEAKVEASKCPDCFGTGMYYPDGYEKGVARCKHERLR